MYTIGMTIQQVQVNTKFLNALPSEWSKFVTDVKLAKSLYTTNYDQLYPDPLAFVANSPTLYNPSQSLQHSGSLMYPPPQQFTPVYAAPIHHRHHHTPVNPQQHPISPPPFISPSMTQQYQAEFPQLDSSLTVPMFQQGEDPIEYINKAMAFLSAVASRFPPSNNQLTTSSNPRNQATILDGRVTVQQVEGRQNKSYAGTRNRGIATTSKVNFVAGPPRVVKCYNCQGEGHIERWCTQPKRPRNAAWFKEKLILAEAQEAGQILDEEKLAFLADLDDLDAYDLDCDDLSSAKVVLMENLSSCDPEVLSESQYLQESQDAVIQDANPSAPNDLLVLSLVEQMTDHIAHLYKENQTNKMVNESLTAEVERYKEQIAIFEQRLNVDLNKREKLIDSQMDDLIRDRNAKLATFQQDIDTLKETLSNNVKEKESLSKTLIIFKTESKEKESKYIDKEIVLEKQNKELENIIYQRIQPTLYDGSVIAKEHAVISVIDDEETLILE
ncbi:integrase, catalytic region, zinc finger, CCHC-type containing protein [Tanacetum coccineum]